jgi:conjugal transfer pilus assembly protein TraF
MRYQRHVMDKSQVFAERWQRLVWSVPDLDYALEGRPTNAMAVNVFDDHQRNKDAQTVRALAGTHGLIFVFRSDCPFCHRFAPILKRFAQEFNLTVLAVSMDGGRLPEYPDARPDNGIATRLNARSVPALYLTQPARREIRPIGFGLMSDTELLERVATVARDLNDASAKNARTQP